MLSRILVSSFLLAALPSQSPIPWPLGLPIPHTLENNTDQPFTYQWCTPWVTDVTGQPVGMGICALAELLLPPGETVTTWWNQLDSNGQQVPPGLYFVNGVPFVVGAHDLGLRMHGSPHVGVARAVELAATNGASVPYALAASFGTSFGIGLGCGLHLPLDFDWLLVDSLTNPLVFPDFVGVLDADGRTTAPRIVLPDLPVLVGIGFHLAFVTFDPGAPCGFGRVSAPEHVVIQ